MNEQRIHPDLFTPEEALAYLRAVTGNENTLETLRRVHKLPCFPVGKDTVYHRVHLDALVAKLAGIDRSTNASSLKISHG